MQGSRAAQAALVLEVQALGYSQLCCDSTGIWQVTPGAEHGLM